jgi:zinc D-Ala-D-Ala dipeptidase
MIRRRPARFPPACYAGHMRAIVAGVILVAGVAAADEAHGVVDLHGVSPSVRIDIRYATENNFLHKKMYDSARCLLRPAVAAALAQVQEDLQRRGLGLKVFDCYRPPAVQKLLWAALPDERYVANPAKGSRHNRGAAVDLTLVDAEGRELAMPTEYDAFSPKTHRGYMTLPKDVLRNRRVLEEAMARRGFVGLPTEWWHFDFRDWQRYRIEDIKDGDAPAR